MTEHERGNFTVTWVRPLIRGVSMVLIDLQPLVDETPFRRPAVRYPARWPGNPEKSFGPPKKESQPARPGSSNIEVTWSEAAMEKTNRSGTHTASLGQYGDAGMRPDKCSAMMHLGVMAHYALGSVYPVGGSGAIPRKLNAVVLEAGGRSFVQARVRSLLLGADGACVGVRARMGSDAAAVRPGRQR